jgi:hypothetical protein
MSKIELELERFEKVQEFLKAQSKLSLGYMTIMWPCVTYSAWADKESWELTVLDVVKNQDWVDKFFCLNTDFIKVIRERGDTEMATILDEIQNFIKTI